MSRPPAPVARRPARQTGPDEPDVSLAERARRLLWRAPALGALRGTRRPRSGGRSGAGSGATEGAPRWVSGLLAGAQAALLSFLVVVMPTMAAYVATSADPSNAEIGWPRSVAVGAALWLLGHGASLDAGGGHVTLVPLGLTVLAVFTASASARRTAHATRSAWLAGIGGYLATVAVVTLGVGSAGPLGAGPGSLLRLAFGATLVAAVGLGSALISPAALREATRPAWSVLPRLLRVGTTGGVVALAALVAVAAVVTSGWVLAGRAATGDVVQALGMDVFGGVVLSVGQLVLLPNLVGWALAWLAGPGFAVGEGTVWSPDQVVGGPLPALPLLGALPPEASGPLRWAPVLVVLCGALAGWWLHRTVRATRVWEPALLAVVTGLVAGLLAGALTALAGGSAGPGRLAVVGGASGSVGLAVAGLVLVGAVLVAVPSDALVRSAVRRGLTGAWAAIRGTGAPDPVGD